MGECRGPSCERGLGVIAVPYKLNRIKRRTDKYTREKNKPRPQKMSLQGRVGHL